MMLLRIIVAVIMTAVLSTAAIFLLPIDRSHRSFYGIGRQWARMMLRLFGVKVTVKGLEHLAPGQHYVYVSNHASMFDIPAVMASIPDNINIVLKKELTRVPIWGWALKLGPYIVIDRFNPREASRSLEEAAEKICGGRSAQLYAEGTRTRDGKLQPFKRGAFALAVKSGIPVVPLTINNTFRILKKGSLKINPADIELVVEKPIATQNYSGKEGELKLMTQVHSAIARHYIDQSEQTAP
ncbi:MAG: 1-acyl-sn-glycerol-3-phosphate acyltransferase [Ignavibacteriales bacterium]|nr:1-acyl-sn-glycerol-3-phosphate acyltransferase [Ignavibacteriales bacterium]